MRQVFLLAVMVVLSSCCQAPSTQVVSGAETVALVGQVVTLEPPFLTLSSGQTITSQLNPNTRILNEQGDTLTTTALVPGTTIWLSMTGDANAWHAQEIRVLPR
jgi:hypothetical protein